jgi:hypothetical protein
VIVRHRASSGDWAKDSRRFIGAIVTVYEIMLEHTIRLLVMCFDILLQYTQVSVYRLDGLCGVVVDELGLHCRVTSSATSSFGIP